MAALVQTCRSVAWRLSALGGDSAIEPVRQATLRALLRLAALADFAVWWYFALTLREGVGALALLVAVTLYLGLIWRLADKSPRIGALVLYVSLQAGSVLWLWVGGQAPLGFLCLPILAGATTIHPLLALGAAAVAVAALALQSGGLPLLPAGSLVCCAAATYATLDPLYDVLGWHYRNSLQTASMADELRDQRGKLNRTIKDLGNSYYLLRQSNRQLAEARQEADALRQLRSRFATNLSHELRTPLNIILGFARLIYLNPGLYGYSRWDDALQGDLGQVQRNAAYLSDLVDDIVDLARVDALAMPVRREPCDLGQLLEEAVAAARSLAVEKQLLLRTDIADSLPPVPVDEVRVRQVVFNLVTNAIRHTESGEVVVSCRLEPEAATVSVSDTGCGIPEHELAHVFDEFYQVARSKRLGQGGKGLGLAIAKRFVQLHGGRIWVNSRVDVGSIFSFTLPLASKSVTLQSPPGHLVATGERAKPVVVVTNDDGATSAYLRLRLPEYGFVPVDAPEALAETLAGVAPVAAVHSLSLNDGSDQWEEALAHLPAGMPVIRCHLPNWEWIGGGRFARVLTKPVAAEDLLTAVGGLVDASQGRRVQIQILDDDRGFVQLLSRTLQSVPGGGYAVAVAYDGREALRSMAKRPPDLALLDLMLPGMSGFEVLEAMRADPRLAKVPVIAISAATPGEDEMAVRGATFIYSRAGAFRAGELVALLETGLSLSSGRPLPEPAAGQ